MIAGRPIQIIAGKEISVPPPAIELMTPAMNAATAMIVSAKGGQFIAEDTHAEDDHHLFHRCGDRTIEVMGTLNGKVAIVTGGASGIGAAIARRFAAEGAAVCISDLHLEAAQALASTLPRAIAVAADVSDESAVASLVDRTVAELGALDVMVSNAGIGERPVPIDERPAEEWSRVIATNLNGVFFGIKHAARVMKKAGRGGVILNMSSILGSVGFNGAPAYTAAKHGVNGLTQAAALELAPAKIRAAGVAARAPEHPGLRRRPRIHPHADDGRHGGGRAPAPPARPPRRAGGGREPLRLPRSLRGGLHRP